MQNFHLTKREDRPATIQEHADLRATVKRLMAEKQEAYRTIWMLVKENGGGVVLNKSTKESYPGDDKAAIETTEQPNNGCTIYRALPS